MRRILLIVLASILIAAGAFAEPAEFEAFVIDPCGGCMGRVGVGCKSCSIIDEMTVRYRQLFGKEIKLTIHNLRMDNTQFPVLQERLSEMGVEPENVPLPVVFVNGEAFLADGSMDSAIAEFLKGGESPGIQALLREKAEHEADREPGRVVYLYSAYCEDCRDISKWLEYSLPNGYELVKYDIYTEIGRAMEDYCIERLGIPEEEYRVPLIVYGDYWFAGKKAIYLSLKSRIQEHPDLQTSILEEITQGD